MHDGYRRARVSRVMDGWWGDVASNAVGTILGGLVLGGIAGFVAAFFRFLVRHYRTSAMALGDRLTAYLMRLAVVLVGVAVAALMYAFAFRNQLDRARGPDASLLEGYIRAGGLALIVLIVVLGVGLLILGVLQVGFNLGLFIAVANEPADDSTGASDSRAVDTARADVSPPRRHGWVLLAGLLGGYAYARSRIRRQE